MKDDKNNETSGYRRGNIYKKGHQNGSQNEIIAFLLSKTLNFFQNQTSKDITTESLKQTENPVVGC